MKDPLGRLIAGLLTLFVLLVTAVAVVGTTRAWGLHDRAHRTDPVSRAEVVSMQPSAGRPPQIRVIGPTGSEVTVGGTKDLKRPYPSEGDYIDVVFSSSGGAVIPPVRSPGDTALATVLIVTIWLGWCAVALGSVTGGRLLVATVTRWRPHRRRSRAPRSRRAVGEPAGD